MGYLKKDCLTCSGKVTAGGIQVKPRKPASRNYQKPDSGGFDSVSQWALTCDDSHLSLASHQEVILQSPGHKLKRNIHEIIIVLAHGKRELIYDLGLQKVLIIHV